MSPSSYPPLSILCFDDDQNFIHQVGDCATQLHFSLTYANSFEKINQLIKEKEFNAFLINGEIDQNAGLELVKTIRKNFESKPLIALFYPTKKENFRHLKESLSINCLTTKPLKSEDIKAILLSFYQESQPPTKPVPEGLKLIKHEYLLSIFDKIDSVENHIQAIKKNLSKDELDVLKKELHKIAGSAGSYGFMTVSLICREKEHVLAPIIENFATFQVTPEWLSQFDDFFKQFKLYFQIPSTPLH